MKIRPVGVE